MLINKISKLFVNFIAISSAVCVQCSTQSSENKNGSSGGVAKKNEAGSGSENRSVQLSANKHARKTARVMEFHRFDDVSLESVKELNATKKAKAYMKKTITSSGKSGCAGIKECFIVGNIGLDIITNIDMINMIKYLMISNGIEYDENLAVCIANEVINMIANRRYQAIVGLENNIVFDDMAVIHAVQNMAKSQNVSTEEFLKNIASRNINIHTFLEDIRWQNHTNSVAQSLLQHVTLARDSYDNARRIMEKESATPSYKFMRLNPSFGLVSFNKFVDTISGKNSAGYNIAAIFNYIKESMGEPGVVAYPKWKVWSRTKKILDATHVNGIAKHKTSNGQDYAIYLIENAMSRRSSELYEYTAVMAHIKNTVTIFSNKESITNFNRKVMQLQNTKTKDEFVKICNQNGWQYNEFVSKRNDARYEMMVQIDENNAAKNTVIIPYKQDSQDEFIAVLITKKEKTKNVIQDHEVSDRVVASKLSTLLSIETKRAQAIFGNLLINQNVDRLMKSLKNT